MTEIHNEQLRSSVRTPTSGTQNKPRKKKPPIGPMHCALRSATRDGQASIDYFLVRFNLNRVMDYQIFLRVHYRALMRLRADWRREDAEDFSQMLERLRADLGTLGERVDSPKSSSRWARNLPTGMGISYVVRSSRLSGEVMRRDIIAPLPTSYLDLVPALSWGSFLGELESIGYNAAQTAEATRAARAAIGQFVVEYGSLANVIKMPRRFDIAAFPR